MHSTDVKPSEPCVGEPPTCCQPEPLTFEELLGPVPGGQRCPECGSSYTAACLLPTVLGQGRWECWECLAIFTVETVQP